MIPIVPSHDKGLAMFRLDGRSALITGGTQGVGAAIAMSLAKGGANVVLHGLEPTESAESTLETCRSFGVAAHAIYHDLSTSTN